MVVQQVTGKYTQTRRDPSHTRTPSAVHTQGHRLGKHIVSATAVTEEAADTFPLLNMIGS